MRDCDVLVIGGGPAGLTAATYLARFRRDVLLVDAGHSRARLIPVSHNCPGFAHGVGGERLLAELRRQAALHGVQPLHAAVSTLRRDGFGFVAEIPGGRIRARRVVLATGIVDALPDIEGAEAAVRRGLLRLCAICDAYETRGLRAGVYGPAPLALPHARYLRSFCAQVTALVTQGHVQAPPEGIKVIAGVNALAISGDEVIARTASGDVHHFDVVYPVLGAAACSRLAMDTGARCDANGDIVTDAHQRTSVEGLYAIGDVVRALNQIAVAAGHAAIAASAIHNDLPYRALAAN